VTSPDTEELDVLAGDRDILVYDADGAGHRANYVDIFSRLTGGAGVIAPIHRALPRLLAAPYLVLTTLETAPKRFLGLLLLRSVLGRPSAVVSLRAHLHVRGGGPGGLAGRLGVRLLERLHCVLPLSLVPLGDGHEAFIAIRDPECWDLAPADLEAPDTELSDRLRAFAAGRRILLLIGNLDFSKGLAFLGDIFLGDPSLFETVVPALCGPVLAEGRAVADSLEAGGAFVESRYLDRAELMSLYRAADAAWCCYPPERDLSSGIFGRAAQFGTAAVLRRGSVLDAMAAGVPNAVRIDYDAPEAAREALRASLIRLPPPAANAARERSALRALLLSHFPGRGRTGPASA
jgi:hypothetical protein